MHTQNDAGDATPDISVRGFSVENETKRTLDSSSDAKLGGTVLRPAPLLLRAFSRSNASAPIMPPTIDSMREVDRGERQANRYDSIMLTDSGSIGWVR